MREKYDNYPTPEKIVERMVREFLDVQISAVKMGNIRPPIPVWDPCAGDGRIAKKVRSHGVEAIETDIVTGNDFFDYDTPMPEGTCAVSQVPAQPVCHDGLA